MSPEMDFMVTNLTFSHMMTEKTHHCPLLSSANGPSMVGKVYNISVMNKMVTLIVV